MSERTDTTTSEIELHDGRVAHAGGGDVAAAAGEQIPQAETKTATPGKNRDNGDLLSPASLAKASPIKAKAAKPVKAARTAAAKAPKVAAAPSNARPVVGRTTKAAAGASAIAVKQPAIARAKPKVLKKSSVRQAPRLSALASHAAVDIADANTSAGKPSKNVAVAAIQKLVDGAIAKSSVSLGQATALTKGNAAAIAASGKVLGGGLRDIAGGCVADGRAAIEKMKGDAAKIAAIRSPSDLLSFNTQTLTRNLRALLEFSTKNSGAMVKLAKDSSAPLSERFTDVASSFGRG